MPCICKCEIAFLFWLEAHVAQSCEDLMLSPLMVAKGKVVLRRDRGSCRLKALGPGLVHPVILHDSF